MVLPLFKYHGYKPRSKFHQSPLNTNRMFLMVSDGSICLYNGILLEPNLTPIETKKMYTDVNIQPMETIRITLTCRVLNTELLKCLLTRQLEPI